MRPKDEFSGLFSRLSTRSIIPLVTMASVTEVTDFAEFVDARLEMVQIVFAFDPKRTLTHGVLSNSSVVCQIIPTASETSAEFIARLRLHAHNMQAHSFFFCRITPTVGPRVTYNVLWVAHHINQGEDFLRAGTIPISDDGLGEIAEDENPDLGVAGDVLLQVLR